VTVLFILIPVAVLLGATFLVAFAWGAAEGQYDDLETPAHRILLPDNERER
jgi:cbb3-type cytochrome oxidase maturation protein